MIHIEVGEKDNLDQKLREFRRAVIQEGIFDEIRKRKEFRNKRGLKKYKIEVENRRRARRNRRRKEKAAEAAG